MTFFPSPKESHRRLKTFFVLCCGWNGLACFFCKIVVDFSIKFKTWFSWNAALVIGCNKKLYFCCLKKDVSSFVQACENIATSCQASNAMTDQKTIMSKRHTNFRSLPDGFLIDIGSQDMAISITRRTLGSRHAFKQPGGSQKEAKTLANLRLNRLLRDNQRWLRNQNPPRR